MPVRLQLSRPFLPQSLCLCSTLRFAPSPQSKHLHFTLYRCTKSVTYTASSVFAVGYAYSAALALPRVEDSRSPKPSRKPDRGTPVSAPAILSRQTRSDGCRGSLFTIPGRRRTSPAEAVRQAEFALMDAHLVLFAVGRERTKAYSILVPTSG
jgi:hypothetical protein